MEQLAGVIRIATNENSQMNPQSLEEAIRKAKAEGQQPFCVVATVGTTVTGTLTRWLNRKDCQGA
jgi:glutamate/tyrosine decarboxylase-like PLP-dependent enzyme